MQLVFGTLATLGFLAALGVHVGALLGMPVQDQIPQVWVLHVGVFVVFIPAFFHLKKHTEKGDPLGYFRRMPAWAVVLLLALFLYLFLNFSVLRSAPGEGTPDIRNGQYVLHKKGHVLREISQAEYRAGRAAEARLSSGHWLLFYALSAAVFLVRSKRGEG